MKYNNIAIFCDNNEEIMMFLNYCQDIELLWRGGEKPLEFILPTEQKLMDFLNG